MMGRPPSKEAPPFGQRLAALRRARGLTQRELADQLGVSRAMVDYYERRATNPTLDVITRAAAALDVAPAELTGDGPAQPPARRGPAPKLLDRFERVRELSRKDQDFILKFIDTYLERAASRKAS